MATVWRAWLYHAPDASSENAAQNAGKKRPEPELFALKELRLEGAEADSLRDFFFEEAAALKRLSHPNVVAYRDLFCFRDSLCLAMEFVPGETFEQLLLRRRKQVAASPAAVPGIEPARAIAYALQLFGALAACHALGVVHRDIKPSNILLRPDGVVKITDFGIAKVRARKPSTPGEVEPEETIVAGTGAYMAPEQVQGVAVDGRADLYAAAIVLFASLTGRLPFPIDGKNEYQVRWDQVHTAPIPFLSLATDAPPALGAFFDRALAKDRDARYPDGISLGDALLAAAGMRADAGWDAQREAAARAAASRKGATTAFSAHAPKATVFELPVPSVAPTSRKGATMPITIPPVVAPRTVPVLPTVPPRGREEK
jgi:serine/threonine-protein kinase